MTISGRCCACLTVQQPGARLAVADEQRALDTRRVSVKPLRTMQRWIRSAQNAAPPLGRVVPVEEDPKAPATRKRVVPHHGRIQMPMGCFGPGSEVLEPAQGLDVTLSILCAPGPTALRVRTGVENHAVGVAPPCGAGVQIEADNVSQVCLLRLVALHAMIGDARR
jgi:hypothetical protein